MACFQALGWMPVMFERQGHRGVGKGALFARRAHLRRRRWARRPSAVSPLEAVPGAFAHPTNPRFT